MVVHHALDGVGALRPGKLLLVGLHAHHHRHGQHFLAQLGVDAVHPLRLLNGLLGGGVEGVALLPEEFAVAQEGTGGLFPAQHGAPLVIQHGQVPPGVDHIGPVVTEQGLRRGADAHTLVQLLAAAIGHPGALGGEALHMVLLLLEQGLGDQHGHGHVGVPRLLKAAVQICLNILPDGIAVGAEDKHSLGLGVADELRLGTHVGVPLGKVHIHIGDLAHLLALVLCHVASILLYKMGFSIS